MAREINLRRSSQIYVRYEGKLIIANYYQWNYGERMISRARYGMKKIQYCLEHNLDFAFHSIQDVQKISRLFDVNFDMKDVTLSTNIFSKYKEFGENSETLVIMGSFQDNSDGQLLIDIVGGKIKYVFIDPYTVEFKPLSAAEYMDWDMGYDWRKNLEEDDVKTCEKKYKSNQKNGKAYDIR